MHVHGLPGLFVVLEGREGVGKSTQVAALRRLLPDQYPEREFVFTREPGGTSYADRIYELFKQGMDVASARTQFCLVFASRFAHVEQVVMPALARGAVVVCDRFLGSTYAYQAIGLEDPSLFVPFFALAELVPLPNLSLIIEAPTAVVLARLAARTGQELSAFDRANRGFHDRLAEGFVRYAADAAGHPCQFIDGNRSADEVTEQLLWHLRPLL